MDRPRIILIGAAVVLVLVLALGAAAQVAQGRMGLLGPIRAENGDGPNLSLPLTGRGNDNDDNDESPGRWNGFPFFNRSNDTEGVAYGELDRFSELVDYNLENENGENVGRIDSALVHAQSGKIMYLIVRPEEAGDRYVAIPWSAIKAVKFGDDNDKNNPGNDGNGEGNGDKNKKEKNNDKGKGNDAFSLLPGIFDRNNKGNPHSYALVYTRDLAELNDAPDFTRQELDNWYEVDHSNQPRDYWRGRGADVSDEENSGGPTLVRLSDARYTIVDRDNNEVGRMQEVILELPQGRASYAVINRGGLSLSGNYIVVPFSRLSWNQLQSDRVVTLDENPDLIRGAHRYRNLDEVPYPGDDGWDNDLQDYWGSDDD